MMPSRIYLNAAALVVELLGGFVLAVSAMPALAGEQIDPAAYPELTPEAVLPAILVELRHTLPDVYSVREVRICPASHIKLKDGRPNGWTINYELNAKNVAGGYTGVRLEVAIFKNGRIANPTGTSPQLGREGLDGVFSRMVDKQMAQCKPIPDATIQQLLAQRQ